MAVPPEPPAEMMPITPCCRAIQARKASVMAATACPDRPSDARRTGGQGQCHLLRRDIGALVAAIRRQIDKPRPQSGGLDEITQEAQFLALGVERAAMITCGTCGARAASGETSPTRRPSTVARVGRDMVRAWASMRAAGTSCDQRVGRTGLAL